MIVCFFTRVNKIVEDRLKLLAVSCVLSAEQERAKERIYDYTYAKRYRSIAVGSWHDEDMVIPRPRYARDKSFATLRD